MSVQSVEIKDVCRTWRAKDGSSYYVTLSHVCRDGRIGTGVGKPLVGLPPAFGLGRNYRTNNSVHNICEDAETDGCFKADCKPEHEMELVDMIDSEIPGQ